MSRGEASDQDLSARAVNHDANAPFFPPGGSFSSPAAPASRPPSPAQLSRGKQVRFARPIHECRSRPAQVAPAARGLCHSARHDLTECPFLVEIPGEMSFPQRDSWRNVLGPARFLANSVSCRLIPAAMFSLPGRSWRKCLFAECFLTRNPFFGRISDVKLPYGWGVETISERTARAGGAAADTRDDPPATTRKTIFFRPLYGLDCRDPESYPSGAHVKTLPGTFWRLVRGPGPVAGSGGKVFAQRGLAPRACRAFRVCPARLGHVFPGAKRGEC